MALYDDTILESFDLNPKQTPAPTVLTSDILWDDSQLAKQFKNTPLIMQQSMPQMKLVVGLSIKYLEGAHRMDKIVQGDWIDCYNYEEVKLKSGDFALLSLGFALELPEGVEAHLVPRSSTFKNYGIIQTNSMGVIDSSYCGDDDIWMMPVYAIHDTVVPKDARICQFRIEMNQPEIHFEEVDSLGNSNRGGFGSTGQ